MWGQELVANRAEVCSVWTALWDLNPYGGISMRSGLWSSESGSAALADFPETRKSDGGIDVELISLFIFAMKWAFPR